MFPDIMSSPFTHVPKATEPGDCELQLLLYLVFLVYSVTVKCMTNNGMKGSWPHSFKDFPGFCFLWPSRQISQATPLILLLLSSSALLQDHLPHKTKPLSIVGVEPVWGAVLHSHTSIILCLLGYVFSYTGHRLLLTTCCHCELPPVQP